MPEKRGNIEDILRYLVSTQYCAEILVDRAPDHYTNGFYIENVGIFAKDIIPDRARFDIPYWCPSDVTVLVEMLKHSGVPTVATNTKQKGR